MIQECIEGLKKGKAAGLDGLVAEHFAHPILTVHLSCLFTMLYKHSLVPDEFGRGIVIQLLKNVDGNKFTTDNYRGITLRPVINKLFETVLLSQFKNQLISDPLQFGFKSKSSCSTRYFYIQDCCRLLC